MKKKLMMFLLSTMMILGMSITVYAGDERGSFVANSMQMTAQSYSVNSTTHRHNFRVHIKAYNNTYSNYIEVDADRLFSSTTTSKKTILIPETYGDSTYRGRYFKGMQYCTIIVNGEHFNYPKYIE